MNIYIYIIYGIRYLALWVLYFEFESFVPLLMAVVVVGVEQVEDLSASRTAVNAAVLGAFRMHFLRQLTPFGN